jgi:hypothetical protein
MADQQTIKQLYKLALAEGEGVGTAYEYYAKRLLLLPWLRYSYPPNTLLVAGLPEKYGSSLDFLRLGADLGAQIFVVDDRAEAIRRLTTALDTLQSDGYTPRLEPTVLQTDDMAGLSALHGSFDLVLSSEVLQRLDTEQRPRYINRLKSMAGKIALFTPNLANTAHVGRSGLRGLSSEELSTLFGSGVASAGAQWQTTSGFIDMPPFPPGMVRSSTQRQDAASGKSEAIAMWGLGYYARAERLAPHFLRRRQSHIVYTLGELPPR